MAKTPTSKSNAQHARDSTVGADYLNTRQLFSQDDSQTQDLDDIEGLAEEQRIQSAFLEATKQYSKKDGRRVTFTKVTVNDEELTTPDDGDELADDNRGTSLIIKDILTNLDQGAEQFVKEVEAHPHYVYSLMGKLCNSLHLLQEHNDLLHQSNTRNVKMREQLASRHQEDQERLQEATKKITQLAQAQEHDPQEEARASAQLGLMKEKNEWYADTIKEKDTASDKVNSDMAELAQERDDLDNECSRLKAELEAVTRGRPRSPSRTPAPARSLSPWTKAHTMGPPPQRTAGPPPLPDQHTARRVSRSASRAETCTHTQREATAATDNSNASRASVNLDPESSKAIQVDRSVKDPDKFEGKANTFYPWLTSMTLKLSTAIFRTEGDGLRYVQGFLGGPPWGLVAPRIPTVGGWGKPCPNPFPDVDSLMRLLAERYGEDNTEERAMNAMVVLKQTEKQDFNLFYATYQEHQSYCPMATDKQEVHRLQGKLNSRFRDKLNDGMEISSLRDLVARCTRLQTQWETMDAPSAGNSEPRGGRRSRRKDDEPATGEPTVRKAYTKIDVPSNELPREYRNMPPLTNEVRQALRDSGGCYKCRKPGHTGNQRDKCPLAILEDAYAAKHPKVNQVEVADADGAPPGNGIATR
jgi:hypothetical protein